MPRNMLKQMRTPMIIPEPMLSSEIERPTPVGTGINPAPIPITSMIQVRAVAIMHSAEALIAATMPAADLRACPPSESSRIRVSAAAMPSGKASFSSSM